MFELIILIVVSCKRESLAFDSILGMDLSTNYVGLSSLSYRTSLSGVLLK